MALPHAAIALRRNPALKFSIDAIKRSEADCAISAGNTGALAAMARLHLKMLEGVDRPAIAALWPTLKGESIVRDLGAAMGADANHLVQLAVMGGAMSRALFGIERPSVGLLISASREIKGLEAIRDAGRMLREANFPDVNCGQRNQRALTPRTPLSRS